MPPTNEPTKSDEPFANISVVKYRGPINEVIQLRPIRLDILEDGRNTDQRIGALYITLPPGVPGPPQHWHQVRGTYQRLAQSPPSSSFPIQTRTGQVIPPRFCDHTNSVFGHLSKMHDETFLVIKGTGTFYSRSDRVDAAVGDYVIVPPHAPHTFGNKSRDEELIIYNTFTPAYYVNYFRLMAKMVKEQGAEGITPEIGREAMAQYATIQTKW